MQHKIGYNYREILKTRKTKRDYPHIGKLPAQLDILRLQQEVSALLDRDLQDANTTETHYRLNNHAGDKFIKEYDSVIQHYSSITFNKITSEAADYAASLTKTMEEFTPLDRLKGMVDTGSKFYHPYYDERNYTDFTEHATGYIREILDGFKSTPCRAAIVVLRPGQRISRHFDIGPDFLIRLQIPIFTTPSAIMGFKTDTGWAQYHMPADGSMYAVNAGIEHWAMNTSDAVRYHLRICLTSQEDTAGMTEFPPLSRITDTDFVGHLCS